MALQKIIEGMTGQQAADIILNNDLESYTVINESFNVQGTKRHPEVAGVGYWTGTVGNPITVNPLANYERNPVTPVTPGDVVEFLGVYVSGTDEGVAALLDINSNYVSRVQGNNATEFNQALGYFKMVIPSGVYYIAPYHRIDGGVDFPTSDILMAINHKILLNPSILPKATTSTEGVTLLTSVESNREDIAATPKLVQDVKNFILKSDFSRLAFTNEGAGFWTGTVGQPPTVSTQYGGYRYMSIFNVETPTTLKIKGISTGTPGSISVFLELDESGLIIRRVNYSTGTTEGDGRVFVLTPNTKKIAFNVLTTTTPPTDPAEVIIELGTESYELNPEIKVNSDVKKLNAVTSMYDRGSAEKKYAATSAKKCIIVAGQSNTDGRVPAAQFPLTFLDENNATVNYLTGGIIENSKYSKNQNTPAFAPFTLGSSLWAYDAIVLRRLIHLLGEEIYMIKRSLGGTAIDPAGTYGGGYWTPRTENIPQGQHLVIRFEESVRKAIESGEIEVIACLWHQGESDSGLIPSQKYYGNFIDVIDYVRGFVGKPTLPFIFGTISHASGQYSPLVEKAMFDVYEQDANVHLVDMRNGTLLDAYHFDAVSTEYLGTEMYKIIRDEIL